MKLLRNPVVVGVLAVVAVLFVLNALRPILPHRAASAASAAAPAQPSTAPADTSAAEAAASQADDAKPTGQTDWSELAKQYVHWADAPKRDPFHIRNGGATNEESDTAKLLTLNAVWQSSATTLAVINNRVVDKGDTIQGYQIDSIEPDGVWVLGPNGREEVHFGLLSQPASNSAGPGTANMDVFEAGLRTAHANEPVNLNLGSAFRLSTLEVAKAKAKAEGKLLGFVMVWDQFFRPSQPMGDRGSEDGLAHFYVAFNKALVLVFVRHEAELNQVPEAVRQGFSGPDEGGYAPNMAVVTADCSQYVCEIPYGGKESNGKIREKIFRDKIGVIKDFLSDQAAAGASRRPMAP